MGMASTYESELEAELEQELSGLHEGELEGEGEGEGELGGLLSGLFGEGEGEGELEFEGEGEGELELEGESGEQFSFGGMFKKIGNFVKKAAPILKKVAKVAAPMVGTAIGGPFGAILGNLASSALGEGELEGEFELEGELEFEGEFEMEGESESESEMAHEIISHEQTQHEALAELMAESASHEQHEGEAEAMIGAATMTAIGPADRRALRRILPHLMRGVAILTRILRRRRSTRPAVRAIPTIVRRTVNTLKKRAAAGKPVTRRAVARAAATQVRKVLGSPKACTAAIARNVKASRGLKRKRSARAGRG
jgi:hypothetical protein